MFGFCSEAVLLTIKILSSSIQHGSEAETVGYSETERRRLLRQKVVYYNNADN